MFGHYFKQYGGVDNTSLLSDYEDDDGFADFLPTGTKVRVINTIALQLKLKLRLPGILFEA